MSSSTSCRARGPSRLGSIACITLLLLGTGAAPARAAEDDEDETPLLAADVPRGETVYLRPNDATRLDLRDMDGDGRLDMVEVSPRGVSLRFLRSNGRYPDEDDRLVRWPGSKVGWALTDLDGDGASDIVMLVEGSTLRVWTSTAEATESTDLLTDIPGALPRGIRRMNFVHDVDGDGQADIVVPASGHYAIYLGTGSGFVEDPIEVAFEAEIDLEVGDPESLDGRFGEVVRVPLFRLMDIDGDQRRDLVSESEDELLVYLAGDELPPEPDWRIDLAALKAEVDRPTQVNLDDLLSMVAPAVNWEVADLDGSPPWDMVLQRGSRFTVHLGGSHGLDPGRADQVLKASGNVMHFLLRDTDGDGAVDLQMLRAETISLGRVLRWLVIAGSLDFDVFTYRNEGGTFARRPSERKTISLRVPALIGFVSGMEDMESELEARFDWPAQPACFGDDGRVDDVVDVRDRTIELYRDLVPGDFQPGIVEQLRDLGPEAMLEQNLIRRLDDLEDGGVKVIDLGEATSLIPTPSYDLHLAAERAEPFARYALPDQMVSLRALRPLDIDGDGRSDIVAVGQDAEGAVVAQILVLP